MDATSVRRVLRIEKRITIMMFLKKKRKGKQRAYLARVKLTVTKTKYLAPALSNKSSHALALNLLAVKFGMKSSYTTV